MSYNFLIQRGSTPDFKVNGDQSKWYITRETWQGARILSVDLVGGPCDTDVDAANLRDELKSTNAAAVALGALGGKSKSERKVAAVRANGRKGGRPMSIDTKAVRLGNKMVKQNHTPEEIADAISKLYQDAGISAEAKTTRGLSLSLPSHWTRRVHLHAGGDPQWG